MAVPASGIMYFFKPRYNVKDITLSGGGGGLHFSFDFRETVGDSGPHVPSVSWLVYSADMIYLV